MAAPIVVTPSVLVPAAAIRFAASRSGGPGGQNVNKVASKVELRIDLARVTGLDEGARARLAARVVGRLDADGWLLVVSQLTRDQIQNLEDARTKVAEVIKAALVVPRRRKKTKPTRGSVERRLTEKRKAGERKRNRRDSD